MYIKPRFIPKTAKASAHASIFPYCNGLKVMGTEDEDKHVICWSNTIPVAWPLPLAATTTLNGVSLTGLGLAGTESESPHLAYICGLRSFDFWLMASSSSTKAGLFWRLRAFRLHSALAPVTTAGTAFHRRGLSPARPADGEEMSTAHSMGKPSSNRPFQHLLSGTSKRL